MDGLQCLAQVGGHEELHLVHAGVVHAVLAGAGGKFGHKLHFWHIQLTQLLLHPLLEAVRRLFPGLGQGLSPLPGLFSGFIQLLFQLLDGVVGVLDLLQLCLAFLQIVQHVGHGRAVFLFQAVDHIQPALQLVQLLR